MTTTEITTGMSSTEGETPTSGETPTTGDETSTTGDETSTTEDPTTGEPTTGDESTTGEPGADDDADGVVNELDNCPCHANPNQLDFDGNTVGNVCDVPLKFTTVDGEPPEFNQLVTTVHAEKVLDCDVVVNLVVLDSVIEVALDDVGAARIYASRINYADTPELSCDLGGGAVVKFKVEEFFADGVDPFVVGFPFTIPDHDGGMVAGGMDAAQAILASSIIHVTESPNKMFLPEGKEAMSMIPGVFPAAAVTVLDKEQQISLVFADNDTVLFEQTTTSGVTFRLTGLTGTLRLQQ